MDNALLSTLMRIAQNPESSLYACTLDVVKALLQVTTHNTL
jgi:hypothetical protein